MVGLDPFIDPELAKEVQADFKLYAQTMLDNSFDPALKDVRFEAAYTRLSDGIAGECLVHLPAAWLRARQPGPLVDFTELAQLPDSTVAVLDLPFDPSAEERRLRQPGGQYWWSNVLWFLGQDLEGEEYRQAINATWRSLAGPARVLLARDESGEMTLTATAELTAASDAALRANLEKVATQLPGMVQAVSGEFWRIITPVGIHLTIRAEERSWQATTDQRGLDWLRDYAGPRLGEAADFQRDVATVPEDCRAFLFVRPHAYVEASAQFVAKLLPLAGGAEALQQANEKMALAQEFAGDSHWVGWIANDPVGYRIGGYGPIGDPSLWLFARSTNAIRLTFKLLPFTTEAQRRHRAIGANSIRCIIYLMSSPCLLCEATKTVVKTLCTASLKNDCSALAE